MSTGLIHAFSLAIGACIGSFLNVCIYRIPLEGHSISSPRNSFCPRCRQPIRWFDNIPVLAWLWLRGRCRSCNVGISWRYPFVEALTALFFLLASIELWDGSFTLPALGALVFWQATLAVLIVITFIDIDHRIIPDELSVTGTMVTPLAAVFVLGVPVEPWLPSWLWSALERADGGNLSGALAWIVVAGAALLAALVAMLLFRRFSPAEDGGRRGWWETRLAAAIGAAVAVVLLGVVALPSWTAGDYARPLLASLFGMAVGAGCIYGIGVLGKIAFRKDAMGFGDVKLMALLGALLGAKFVLLAVFLACLLGSVVGIGIRVVTGSSYMPFGPFLAAGGVALVFWQDWVFRGIDWYMSLFQR